MPIATLASELDGGFEQPLSQAGKIQVIGFPGMPYAGQTFLASGTYVSGVMPADGYQSLTVGITLTHSGTLKVTRWIDAAGTVTRDLTSTAIVANTLLITDLVDDKPYMAFTVEIDNASGAGATITNFAIILNAT